MESFGTARHRYRSDSGVFSSCSNDTFSSRDLTIQPSASSVSLYVREKTRQFEHMAETIKISKERFYKKYLDINNEIDHTIEQVYLMAEAKKRELKSQLQKIADSEILSWNRQLKICEEAEEWLKNRKTDFPDMQETCNLYARDIGFISSSEISFQNENVPSQNITIPSKTIVKEKKEKKIKPKFCFGKRGSNAGEFNRPWGVCSDATGRILVADCGNNRIQIFNEHGTFLLEFGKLGRNAGEFNKPAGVTVHKKCRIIVTDKNNHRVQVFTFNGGFMFMFGRRGSKPGQFLYPWGVDTNSEGEIAIGDSKNHRVQLFCKNGSFISEFRFGNITHELKPCVCPVGVAFKPDGTLLITDISNSAVFKIDEKFSTAAEVKNCLDFGEPQGVACNSFGKFMVADSCENRIQVFDRNENPVWVFGVEGKRPGEFKNPQGICFHPNGGIIVCDLKNRIQVF